MRYGVHIEFIACMTQFYDIFDIYVVLIHYMVSSILCALQLLLIRMIKNYISIMFITPDLGNNSLNNYMLKTYYTGYIS